MRAWLLPGFTGLESLKPGEFPDPRPAKDEVVLDLHFAALNPADRALAEGQYPSKPAFPHILGRDGVGTVSALGEAVKGIAIGDQRVVLRTEVGVTRPGTLSQRVAIPAEYTTPVPAGWTLEQAAAAPLVYITAWQALTQWGDVKGVDGGLPVVLVTGASGGVGVAAVQLAHAMGHTIAALSRSEEKSKQLRDMGANITLNPQEKSWPKLLKEKLGTKRVDLVVENIGGSGFSQVIETLAMWGRISVVGRLAGPVPDFNTATLLFRRLKIGGVALSTYSNAETHAAWENILRLLNQSGAKPLIDHVFPFDEVPAAFKRLEEGPMGKVVVKV